MSLKDTLHTKYWNTIAKKCKQCCSSIYTIEEGKVLYSCSIYGTFKKDCTLETPKRSLPKPEEILGSNK